MTVNDLNHEFCRVCGKPMVYTGSEDAKKNGHPITLFFYACESNLSNHDKAVYEVEPVEASG